MNETISASPLTWPQGWKREGCRKRSQFGQWNKPVTIHRATDNVLEQLRLMGIPDFKVIISTNLKLRNDGLPYSNQREPTDQGASVWWKDGPKQLVIAIDKYDRIADNLWAIGKTIEAMRGIERWGSGEILERTFTGFESLPDPNSENWRVVLGVPDDVTDMAMVKRQYRTMMSTAHPDHGGTAEGAARINRAYSSAKEELGAGGFYE